MKASSRELYVIRKGELAAERKALLARMVQLALKELVLELERKYGLLGQQATIDVHTGEITTNNVGEHRERSPV